MKSRTQYVLLFGGLLLLLGILLYLVFQEKKLYFLISEVGILILAVIAFKVYQNIFRPFDFLKQGKEALMDEDFNVRITAKGSPDMDALIDVYNQMLDKIRSERIYQQEQHYFLDSLLDILPVGILILNYDDEIDQYNNLAAEYINLSDGDKGNALDSLPHNLVSVLTQMEDESEEMVKLGGVNYYRCLSRKFMHRGFARKYFIIEDLSSEMLKVEKQAYGKVIRMMAHEVNNSMGAINSILHSLLSDERIDEQELREYLPIVIERNEGLGNFMKNFASVIRLPNPDRKSIDLSEVVKKMAVFYQNVAKERGVEIITQDSLDPFMISADKEQIEQVLVNVIQNSLEAIPERGWIRVILSAEHRTLRIIDNGSGISAEDQQHLFSPFYSTKPNGQGIGLTLVKQILFNHDYDFSLNSENGETVFEVRF